VPPDNIDFLALLLHPPNRINVPTHKSRPDPGSKPKGTALTAIFAGPQFPPAIVISDQRLFFINKENNQIINEIRFTNFKCHGRFIL
jgi:hypothetical protein